MAEIRIYDTTLRDGTQGEGVSFSAEDKVRITQKLDKMGFHYVEGGWPGSNPKDLEFFRRIKSLNLQQTRVTAFGSTRRPYTLTQNDVNLQAILSAGVKTATIFGKSWDFQVTEALGTTLEENLAMIRESVAFLKAHGLEVIYDAEHFFDGYAANPAYALATLQAAGEGGADTLVLCDTNGGSLPSRVAAVVAAVRQEVDAPLGIHAHNDGELAVANTIAAVEAGVTHVQGTINGYGERCGNANLCSVVPNLQFKLKKSCLPAESLAGFTELSRFVAELANLHPLSYQPYVGQSAFTHKGGVHVNALMKNVRTYEHLDPSLVGNRRRVLVSELSGLANLRFKARELGVALEAMDENRLETRRLLERIKELEHQGFQFEGAEGSLELMLRKALENYQEPFQLENLRVIIEMKDHGYVQAEATIKVRVGDAVMHTAAEGNGPVNALDNALRKALEGFFPQIRNFNLTDYKVRVLDEKDGTGALVRVLIETGDDTRTWGTVGVSSNIIQASWQALVDSIVYGLLQTQRKAP